MTTSINKLLEDIECEGFHDAIHHYDDYSQIPDQKFQELYQQCLKASKELAEYLGVKY
jgi:hypothetical protein